jgi:hypothetical protein
VTLIVGSAGRSVSGCGKSQLAVASVPCSALRKGKRAGWAKPVERPRNTGRRGGLDQTKEKKVGPAWAARAEIKGKIILSKF